MVNGYLRLKNKIMLLVCIFVVAFIMVVLAINKGSVFGDDSNPSYISPGSISLSDEYAYVSDATLMKVYKVNLLNGAVERTSEFNDKVNGLLYNADRVYILTGGLAGNLVVMDENLETVIKTIPVGHTPVAAEIYRNNIYIANRFSSSISVVDTVQLKNIGEIPVSREPMAMALCGTNLFVASHLPSGASNDSKVAADVTVIDMNTHETQAIKLNNGTSGVKDITASPDGKYIYISHILSRYAYPTSQIDRGWICTNAITILDAETKTVKSSVLLDEVEAGASNPWGIEVSDDGSTLMVNLAGTHELMLIDADEMLKRIDDVEAGEGIVEEPSDIPNYLPFLNGARKRISLSGKGPRNIAFKDGKAYICQYFTGDIAVVPIHDTIKTEYISLGAQPANNLVRQGEILWNDATNTYQQWQSCSSCHPDGRVDGFSWDELGDGLGNPKNTRSLLYSHKTPPILITGSGTAEEGVRSSFRGLMFKELPEEKAKAVDEYLKSLKPESSPYLNRNGTLTESAERGRVLFEESGCITCHPAPLFTDMKKHNVGTVDPEEEKNEKLPFDTPTLIEVWRTGPYLFNGKCENITDAIKKHMRGNRKLTDSEMEDLAEYVLSLGSEDKEYSVNSSAKGRNDGVLESDNPSGN